MSLTGSLEDLGLGEILQIVSLSRKTGILALRSRGREGSITFRSGQVVRAASSTHQISLGEVLIRKGVIDLGTLRKALAQQQAEGFRERLGVILTRCYGIPQESVDEVVREQIESVVYSLFAWAEGSYDFEIRESIETVDDNKMDPLQFMLDQGLNPQFLAMEGSRMRGEESDGRTGDEQDGEADARERDSASDGASNNRHLVIVDDDGPTLRALSAGLQERGYTVHPLSRSEDALIAIDGLYRGNERPLILIDLIMPKMDGSGVLGGIELLDLLHNNFKDLSVVMMSDYHHAEAEKKVHELGCPLLMKPRRGEIAREEAVAGFLSVLTADLNRLCTGDSQSPREEAFHLGDELRLEFDDGDPLSTATDPSATNELSLLRGMLEELNNPELQGGVLLLVLRYASEFLNRAIVFTVEDKIVSGVGQFGISGGGGSGDERVRAIHVPLEAESMFHEPWRTCHAKRFKPLSSPVNNHIFEQLGGGVPEEIFIGPIVSRSRVIAFLYGDNLPDNQPISETETLEIFLSQAGMAMEKSMIERQLNERVRP